MLLLWPQKLETMKIRKVDLDLAESIKRSASDRLGKSVPWVQARTFPGFFTAFGFLAFV